MNSAASRTLQNVAKPAETGLKMAFETIPPPPKGLRRRGKAFWIAVNTDFVIEPWKLATLLGACEALDASDAAKRRAAAEGISAKERQAETRLQISATLAFNKSVRELQLDTPVADSSGRGPRLGGRK